MADETKKVQLVAEFDATQVRDGTSDAKDAVRDLSKVAQEEGEKASQGLAKIGTEGTKAARQLEAGERSMSASIQRATALQQAGERGTAQFYESLAKLRGLNVEALAPDLDALRQAEAARKAATGSLDAMGVSAKQTAAALRNVPAQFTDIVTSIASGQAPLTVLLQQGGQLKDMFGGVGNAAKALGGYILGLVNPITVSAAAIGALALSWYKGTAEQATYARTLIATGQAAGVTAGQLTEMAAAVERLGAGTQGRAAEVLAGMAQSGAVGAANLEKFTAAAIRFEQVGGAAAEDTVKAFEQLGRDPLKAALKLNEASNFLTTATYQQIRALEEQGRTVEAARVAQEAYAQSLSERSAAMLQNLGTVERAWLAIKNATKGAADAVLDIGRGSDLEDTIARQEAQVKRLRAVIAGTGVIGPRETAKDLLGIESFAQQADAAQRVLDQLRGALTTQRALAAAAGDRTREVKAAIEWDQAAERSLTKQEQQAREISKIRALGVAAGKTQAEIEQQIAAIRERYAEKAQKAPKAEALQTAELKAYAAALTDLGRIADAAQSKADGLSKTQSKLRDIQADPTWAGYSRQQQEQILTVAALAQAEEDRAAATAQSAKAVEEANRSYAKWRSELDKSAVDIEQQVAKLQLESEAAELSAQGYYSLAQAIQVVEVARLQEQKTMLQGDDVAVAAVEREISARQRLIDMMGSDEARKASAKAAQASAAEWQKAADQINEAMTDALMRAFESGKDFAQAMVDTLVNTLRTTVLRPVIQAIIAPVTGTLFGAASTAAGAAGLPGSGGAAGSLQSAMSLGNLASRGWAGLQNLFGVGPASTMGSIGQGINAFGNAIGSQGLSEFGAGMYGNAPVLGGDAFSLGSAAGTAGAYLGGALAGRYVGKAISNGYSAVGSSGNTAVNAGVIIGAIAGGPIGAAIGGAIGGAVNRAFGRSATEVTSQGVTGTASGGDFTGTNFATKRQKGGWFRSDKNWTETSALTAEVESAFDLAAKTVLEQTKVYAQALKLPAESLSSISQQIRVDLGADEAKNVDAINKAFGAYQETLASQFSASLQPFAKAGESIVDTLSRLGTLQAFSDNLDDLGGVFSRVAGMSYDVRESFIQMAGGMEALSAKALAFAQNYYTRDEVAGLKAAEIQKVLKDNGIGADNVASRDDFRRLVDATDVSTAAGRQQLAVLLDVAASFTQVADYLSETGSTLARVAAQAPTSGAVASLTAQQDDIATAQQVVAIGQVESAVDRLGVLLGKLITVVQGNGRTGFSLEVTQP